MSKDRDLTLDNSKRIPITPKGLKWYLSGVIFLVVALYVIAAIQTDSSPNKVIDGIPIIYHFVIDDLIPPNWSYYNTVAKNLLETWNIALISTSFAAVFSIPFSMMAAANINRNKYFYNIFRIFLNLLRTVPEIILAVIFVAVVGLGAMSGMLALFVFAIGILVKLISETVEAINPGPVEAIRASGGNTLQVIRYAVFPQIITQFFSYTLYVLEINIKASVVLGFVGAGGIGLILKQQLNMFNYGNVSTIILMTFVAISLIDLLSNLLRERLE